MLDAVCAWIRGITIFIIFIASISKIVPGTLLTKLFLKRSWRFSASFGFLMNARGLVELIALNVALELVRIR
jgi:Kef-type K+ transport system membrane component KefB